MNTTEQLLQKALKTQDAGTLYSLFEQAIELAKFHQGQAAVAKANVEKLKAQVERQSKMITNLENTLWKK